MTSLPNANSQIVLASRPDGLPTEANFRLEQTPMPDPGAGEVLVKVHFLSLDPYMRGRMRDRKSYVPPYKIGEVFGGDAVGEVIRSETEGFEAGDMVHGRFGCQTYAAVAGKTLRKVGSDARPLSLALGILGMPGITAYFGLLDLGQPQSGETVVVSAGSGAVGAIVGQIAKIKGCRTVGIAGSDEKNAYCIDELGFDAAINYKTSKNLVKDLRAACPDGVDVYFDNVGGPVSDAVMMCLNNHARIPVCGQISGYNSEEVDVGPRLIWQLIVKRARMEGFLVFDYFDRYAEGLDQLSAWIKAGELKFKEDVSDGIESVPAAFIGMLQGKNFGKQIVKLID